jgi:hypothetical protein
MIGGLFETGQHENRILHLLYTESSDTKYFTLVRHDVSQQHDVTGINRHSVGRHGMLNLVINRLTSCFNTENFTCFHDVIRSSLETVYTCDLACDMGGGEGRTICTHDF